MRLAVSLAAFSLLLVALPAAAADRPAANECTPALMMQVKQVGNVQASPDGKRVVFTVRRAVMDGDRSEYQTHVFLATADGSDVVQLTQGEKSCSSPAWSPDGKTIAFLTDRVGKRNIWLLPVSGGEARQLTHRKSEVVSLKWSPEGKAIAFTSPDEPPAEEERAKQAKDDAVVVDENVKMIRLYVVPADGSATARLLTKGDYSVGNESGASKRGYDWAPDGKSIVFSHTRTPNPDDWAPADLSVVDVAAANVRSLVKSAAAKLSPRYSPDGQWVAYAASGVPAHWADDGVIHVVPAAGGAPRALAETSDGFGRHSDIVGWAADGKHVYFTEAHGTTTRLNVLPLDGPPQELGKVDGVFAGGVTLNASRTAFAFSWETLDAAPEAAVSPVDRFEPKLVSQVNADLPKLPLGKTEVVRWKSPDGLEIEGLLTYPVGYEKGKRYPLLLVVHGGPMGVWQQSYFAAPSQYPLATFAGRGYAVLRANPRGSAGYGKKFRFANYGDWGNGDYKDLMAGVDHLIEQGVADGDRLGVMGWSYGGYMTSWAITQTKRFKAASVGAGVTNLMSFTGTADIPGFLPDYFAGEPWDKFDAYRAHSPMFHVKGVTTPTLIQHGERDARVPLSQGQELYNALKRQGCPTRMVQYPRTPHGIEEPRLLVDSMNRNLQWFEQYVRGK